MIKRQFGIVERFTSRGRLALMGQCYSGRHEFNSNIFMELNCENIIWIFLNHFLETKITPTSITFGEWFEKSKMTNVHIILSSFLQ